MSIHECPNCGTIIPDRDHPFCMVCDAKHRRVLEIKEDAAELAAMLTPKPAVTLIYKEGSDAYYADYAIGYINTLEIQKCVTCGKRQLELRLRTDVNTYSGSGGCPGLYLIMEIKLECKCCAMFTWESKDHRTFEGTENEKEAIRKDIDEMVERWNGRNI